MDIGNIQPGQRLWSEEPFFIGCTSTIFLKMEAIIYADNLPEPQKESLSIQFDVIEKSELTLEKLDLMPEYGGFLKDNLNFHRTLNELADSNPLAASQAE